jgi:putative FmdB family regulatory protein
VPTYQYTCTDCGEPLEAVARFTDPPLETCPACGGRLRKVFSPVGVVFKGSGFYKTDSRAAAKAGKRASADSPTTPGGETGSSRDAARDGSSADAPAKDAPAKEGSAKPAPAGEAGSPAATSGAAADSRGKKPASGSSKVA